MDPNVILARGLAVNAPERRLHLSREGNLAEREGLRSNQVPQNHRK